MSLETKEYPRPPTSLQNPFKKKTKEKAQVTSPQNQSTTKESDSPLHTAVKAGNNETITAVLNTDWELLETRDTEGRTALHLAIITGQKIETIRLLLARGASLQAKDEKGWNALHHAAALGNEKIVDLILQQPAAQFDCQSETKQGETADKLARQKKHTDIAMKLLDYTP